ncbi:hypothetical protein F4860DRAFT_520351 [Xylaria cubensis]|nr:hypothetical protein F4860DRAFT_520351 [Xylaria cubensis]
MYDSLFFLHIRAFSTSSKNAAKGCIANNGYVNVLATLTTLAYIEKIEINYPNEFVAEDGPKLISQWDHFHDDSTLYEQQGLSLKKHSSHSLLDNSKGWRPVVAINSDPLVGWLASAARSPSLTVIPIQSLLRRITFCLLEQQNLSQSRLFHLMSNMEKISDKIARQLVEKRDELSNFKNDLQEAVDILKQLLDKMDEDTQRTLASSSIAVRQYRGQMNTDIDFQQLLKNQEVIINKLEHDIFNTKQELHELGQLFG